MALEKWKESSIKTKIASIGMALSAVLSLIIGFAILGELGEALGFLSGLGVNIGGILVLYVLAYFAIDVVVAIGLFFVKRWARNLTIWWGILAIITVVTSLKFPTPWLLPCIITAISAIFVLIAGSDFKKVKATE